MRQSLYLILRLSFLAKVEPELQYRGTREGREEQPPSPVHPYSTSTQTLHTNNRGILDALLRTFRLDHKS